MNKLISSIGLQFFDLQRYYDGIKFKSFKKLAANVLRTHVSHSLDINSFNSTPCEKEIIRVMLALQTMGMRHCRYSLTYSGNALNEFIICLMY